MTLIGKCPHNIQVEGANISRKSAGEHKIKVPFNMKSHLPEEFGLHCLESPILLPIGAHQQALLGLVRDKEDEATVVVDDINIFRIFFISGSVLPSPASASMSKMNLNIRYMENVNEMREIMFLAHTEIQTSTGQTPLHLWSSSAPLGEVP